MIAKVKRLIPPRHGCQWVIWLDGVEHEAPHLGLSNVKWVVTREEGYALGELCEHVDLLEPRRVRFQKKHQFFVGKSEPLLSSGAAEFRSDGSAWADCSSSNT